MTENARNEIRKVGTTEGVQRPAGWSRRMWWLLPLAVLFLLVGVIYVLGHMGSADSEMYPTTERQSAVDARFC